MLNYPAAAPRNVSCDLLSDLQFDIASLQYETIDQRLRSRLPPGICIGIYYSNEL